MKHVAVLMGGWSAERPVSLNSGRGCADALEARGYTVSRVDVGRDIAEVLARIKPDVAFNALHGRVGEDGAIQGLLEILRIPYTHSGVLASALAMEKDLAKVVLKAAGVPVADGRIVDRREAALRHALPPPYVLKPIAEGSSLGIVIVKEERAHPPQEVGREDWPYGDRLLVERYVAGKELTCAVIGDRATDIIEIQPVSEAFYGYDAKYAKGGSIHVLPANLKPKIYQAVQDLALKAHRALGCRGVSRADFRFDEVERRGRRPRLPRGQYPAGDDRNFVGAGNGRLRGPQFRRFGGMDGGGRVLRPLSESWPWRRAAEPALAGAAARLRAEPVLLRGERARMNALPFGLRLDRPPPRGVGSMLAITLLVGVAAVGFVRGGHYQAFVEAEGGVCDFLARAFGFGVKSITMSGQSRLTPAEVLAIAGVSPKISTPFFDVDLAREKLEQTPLIKQASVRKLYPSQIFIELVERTPAALWQKNGEIRDHRRRRRGDRRIAR